MGINRMAVSFIPYILRCVNSFHGLWGYPYLGPSTHITHVSSWGSLAAIWLCCSLPGPVQLPTCPQRRLLLVPPRPRCAWELWVFSPNPKLLEGWHAGVEKTPHFWNACAWGPPLCSLDPVAFICHVLLQTLLGHEVNMSLVWQMHLLFW